MDNISKYIETNLVIEEFTNHDNENGQEIKSYYLNAKADAIHCYSTIKKYLYKDIFIAFIEDGQVKIYNHDEAVSLLSENIITSKSWVNDGAYTMNKTPVAYEQIITKL